MKQCALILLASVFSISALDDLSTLFSGGKYSMTLTNGDLLVGTIEGKTDTTVILEAQDGVPYTFKGRMISAFELLELPGFQPAEGPASTIGEMVSYDQLLAFPPPTDRLMAVQLVRGPTYTGTLSSLDSVVLRLMIDKKVIPFARMDIAAVSVGAQIASEAPLPKKPDIIPAFAQGPFDTVVVQNPQTDELGNPLQDIIITGKISAETFSTVTLTTTEGQVRSIALPTIRRIFRATPVENDDPIKKYAQPLQCPSDMVLVDMPPGMPDKPFFRVCIDRYEYPNKRDEKVMSNVSYGDARAFCASQGKRLCTTVEWQWSCSGTEGFDYPYGRVQIRDNCNTSTDAAFLEPSGNRNKCAGRFGAYDMTGNVFEWTIDASSKPALMGGPLSRCQTISPSPDGTARALSGFRCCKSN